MFKIKINQPKRRVSMILFWSNYLMLVPFLVADLAIIGSDNSGCLIEGSYS